MSKKLATKKYVDDQIAKTRYFSFTSLDELNTIMQQYPAQCITVVPTVAVKFGTVTIQAWSRCFITFTTTGDTAGFAIYPDTSSFWIIGHTSKGWFAKKIV